MYKRISTIVVICIALFASNNLWSQGEVVTYAGFFDFKWLPKTGQILLDVEGRMDEEFLYVSGLSAGVGSNDIGLDRNQLGEHRIVKFMRSGPKILLVEPNYHYRAVSDNAEEVRAVEEAFAQSVLWGFTLSDSTGQWIDLTPFLLRDAHGVADRLSETDQGNYSLDASRSAIYLERTKNFPDNSEFDALITFTGKAQGDWIRSVAPTPDAISVHIHHAFVRLPDEAYEPRVLDPRSGFYGIDYYDYATPIDQPLKKQFIVRHRLEKEDPMAEVSDAVEPIIYYLDRGCPEPVKSALIAGALWWNDAFEAAGYRNAFQVRELPEDADPMDIRYNVINWVHRSTRGWSYGSSVYDPRTGEILKGHVLLGSLRVRQDYLIAQGLAAPFEGRDESTEALVEMALARLRQLSAHEVGHTLGLMHNFAASVNNRASVMDYPHPYITLESGQLDFSQAYDQGIGAWDKRAIIYGYQDFVEGTDEASALGEIIEETIALGLKYISDDDARPEGGAHPHGHLWDNGANPIPELERLRAVRAYALENFGERTIPVGTPMAYLEEVLVPLYLSHRYQVEAVAKLVGGLDYTYNIRGDRQPDPRIVESAVQERALAALLGTLSPDFLRMDKNFVHLIPPRPPGFERHRELFATHTGVAMDPLAAAEGAADHTLEFLLHPERLARIHNYSAVAPDMFSLPEYLHRIAEGIDRIAVNDPVEAQLKAMVEKLLVRRLLSLAADRKIQQQVSAVALMQAEALEVRFERQLAGKEGDARAHAMYIVQMVDHFSRNPDTFTLPATTTMPPASPIGCAPFLPFPADAHNGSAR